MGSPHAYTVQDKVEWYLGYDTKKMGTGQVLALSPCHVLVWDSKEKKKKNPRYLNLTWPSRSLRRYICQNRRKEHILFHSLLG